jgi:hypothetical protein
VAIPLQNFLAIQAGRAADGRDVFVTLCPEPYPGAKHIGHYFGRAADGTPLYAIAEAFCEIFPGVLVSAIQCGRAIDGRDVYLAYKCPCDFPYGSGSGSEGSGSEGSGSEGSGSEGSGSEGSGSQGSGSEGSGSQGSGSEGSGSSGSGSGADFGCCPERFCVNPPATLHATIIRADGCPDLLGAEADLENQGTLPCEVAYTGEFAKCIKGDPVGQMALLCNEGVNNMFVNFPEQLCNLEEGPYPVEVISCVPFHGIVRNVHTCKFLAMSDCCEEGELDFEITE